MTVGELKKILENHPDDMRICGYHVCWQGDIDIYVEDYTGEEHSSLKIKPSPVLIFDTT